jgi:transcriptional regulator GlxA family with amidase domain
VIEVCFFVLPQTLLLDLAGPAEAFRLANQRHIQLKRPPLFELSFLGPTAQPITSIGLQLNAIKPLPEKLPIPLNGNQRWFVLMGRPGEFLKDGRRLREWLTTRDWLSKHLLPLLSDPNNQDHRLVTICEGALLAADAGLIQDHRCTTHHEVLDLLAQLAPKAQVASNRVFQIDGYLYSSAGITAGIDLALHLIAEQCGELVAAHVAQVMVAYNRRSQDHTAHSPLLAARHHIHPALHRLQNAITENPQADWSLKTMAAHVFVTPRHLARLFAEQIGLTALDYLSQVRTSLAKEYLERGKSRTQAAELVGWNPRQLATRLARL